MSRLNQLYYEFGIGEINDRLEIIEDKLKIKKGIDLTLNHKLLILHHTGILDHLMNQKRSKDSIGKLLSILCNINSENVRKSLSLINQKDAPFKNGHNYNVVKKVLFDCGFKEVVAEIEKQYP